MYRDVTSMDDSDECRVDTALLISRAAAKALLIKPTCDHDTFPICDAMLSSGAKICKVDYCETCPVRARRPLPLLTRVLFLNPNCTGIHA